MKIAKDKSLDLVEVSPNQDPPVVKIIDYSRFRFDQRKKSKEAKKRQTVVHLKEIKLRPAIATHDYEHKVNQAKNFLIKGDKVKFSVRFRGREIVHADLGFKLLQRVQKDLEEIARLEQDPIREGRSISMIMCLLPSGSKKKKRE